MQRNRFRPCLPGLLGAAALLCGLDVLAQNTESAAPGFMELSANSLGTYPGGLRWLCATDNVELSPAGKFLLFSSSRTRRTSLSSAADRILVADVDCLGSQGFAEQCLTTIQGLDGAHPVSWAPDDSRLFVAENLKNIVEFRTAAGSQPLVSFSGRAPVGLLVGGMIAGTGTTSASSAAQEAVRLFGTFARLRSGLRGDSDTAIPIKLLATDPGALVSFKPETLATELVTRDSRVSVGVPRPFLQLGHFSADAAGRRALYDVGWQLVETNEKWTVHNGPPFSRPYTSASGRTLGYYSLKDLRLFGSNARLSRAEQDIRQIIEGHPDSVLWRASGDEKGNYAAAVKSAQGQNRFFGSVDGNRLSHTCPVSKSSRPTPDISLRVKALGSKAWPLGIIEAGPARPKGVIVFAQGGPATDLADFVNHRWVREYLANGWSVLSVGYSGSVGFGTAPSLRLKSEGPGAFRKDARILAQYVNRAYPGMPVIVHGESFGGSPAIALDVALSNRRGGLIAIVPYLRSRPASEWLVTSGFFAANPEYQTQMERAVMGSGDDASRTVFNKSLAALAQGRNFNRPALLIFSAIDKSSQVSDIPAPYLKNSVVRTLKPPHELILVEPGASDAIKEFIGKF